MSSSEEVVDKEYPNEVQLTLFEHLKELRSRLIKALLCVLVFFLMAMAFSDFIYDFLMSAIPEGVEILLLSAPGGFFIRIKLGIYVGIFFSLPVISYQIYAFIRPALRIKENSTAKIYMIGGFILLSGGILFTHTFMPHIIKALNSFSFDGTTVKANAEDYIHFILTAYLGFSVLFQVPLIILLTIAQGFVSADFYSQNRKWVIVILLTLCAIFSPPDLQSQVIIFIPLYALFEIAVLLGRFISKRKCSD